MTNETWQAAIGRLPSLLANRWTDFFWQNKLEYYIFWFAVLAALLAVAYYVITTKIRPEPEKKEPQASQWLSKYREMHSRGELTDEEFRTIKTKLAEKLQDELNDNGESG